MTRGGAAATEEVAEGRRGRGASPAPAVHRRGGIVQVEGAAAGAAGQGAHQAAAVVSSEQHGILVSVPKHDPWGNNFLI